MTDNNNAPRVTLTPDQIKARDAALKVAATDTGKPTGDKPAVAPVTVEHKGTTSNPTLPAGNSLPGKVPPTIGQATSTAAPQSGVSKPTDKPAGLAPTTAASPAKPTSEAPTVTAAINTLVKASQTPPANAIKPATAAPKSLTAPSKPDKALSDRAVAVAKANAAVGKPQGGTVQTKPAGKPATGKGVDVSAAKQKKLGKAETALQNPNFVCGYDLTKWPAALEKIKPTKAVIMAVRATGVLKTYVTKNELALAVYAGPHAREINVYDVATALQNVLGGSHDHKMNTVNQKAVPSGLWVRLPDTRVAGVNGGKPLIAYGVAPSPGGLKRIRAYFEANSLKLPKAWQAENPPSKPADKGNGNGGNHTAKA